MHRAIRRFRGTALGGVLLLLGAPGLCPPAKAETPAVVATIKPVHSIVAAVMQGVGRPALLLPDGASPHAYAMRPTDARTLHEADLVVWVGPSLESFLARSIAALSGDAAVITLIDEPAIRKLENREGGVWDAEDHGHGGRPGRRGVDPHLWLDPSNASAIAGLVADKLSALDPGNAAAYRANARRFAAAMAGLEEEVGARLAEVRAVPFLVFHDGFQYFERRFGLNGVGSLALSPDRPPGARRLSALRRLVLDRGARCVFSEPQFTPALVRVVIRGTDARTGELDPLGTGIEPGPGAYEALIRRLAGAFRGCLS